MTSSRKLTKREYQLAEAVVMLLTSLYRGGGDGSVLDLAEKALTNVGHPYEEWAYKMEDTPDEEMTELQAREYVEIEAWFSDDGDSRDV